MGWLREHNSQVDNAMSRTLHYDTPAADDTHLEGTITSPTITQELPVTFRVPIVKVNGVNDMEATIANVHHMEDLVDQDIARDPSLARVPMDPPDL